MLPIQMILFVLITLFRLINTKLIVMYVNYDRLYFYNTPNNLYKKLFCISTLGII